MKVLLLLSFLLLTLSPLAHANTDVRTWEYESGKKFRAEMVSVDKDFIQATFRTDGQEETFQVAIDELSAIDIAWLKEWSFHFAKMEEQVKKLGGTLSHHLSEGKYPTDYFVYQPKTDLDLSQRPLLILFHPGAKAQRFLQPFLAPAQELGITVVSCDQFKNTDNNAEREAAFLERYQELLPQLEKQLPHHPKKLIMGGTSGGAWKAYHYSAWIDRPWLGIIACAGWLGGEQYADLPYPAMKVGIINGDSDHANRCIKHDSEILESRGCEVGIYSFKGGHQTAPSENLADVLAWILE